MLSRKRAHRIKILSTSKSSRVTDISIVITSALLFCSCLSWSVTSDFNISDFQWFDAFCVWVAKEFTDVLTPSALVFFLCCERPIFRFYASCQGTRPYFFYCFFYSFLHACRFYRIFYCIIHLLAKLTLFVMIVRHVGYSLAFLCIIFCILSFILRISPVMPFFLCLFYLG